MASQSLDRTDYTICLLGTNSKYIKGNDNNHPLSIVMSLIDPGSQLREETPPEHICGQNATIIDGPDVLGLGVDICIQRGLLRTLEAIGSGKTNINIIAHSRGACEAIILTHLLEDIRNAPKDSDLTCYVKKPSWISWLAGFWDSALGQQLLTYLSQNTTAIKKNIENIEVNAFYLDPVPGGAWNGLHLVEWKNPKFSVVPQIVKKYIQIISIHERSAAFQPVIPFQCTTSTVNIRLFPGNHATPAGSLIDQQKTFALSDYPELVRGAFKIQILILGQIIKSLNDNCVVFKQAQHLEPVPQAQGLNLRQIAHQILLYKPSQWNKEELKLYNDIYRAQEQGAFACLTTCSYLTGRDSPTPFSSPYNERRMSVNSIPVGLQQGLTMLGHSQEKSFIDSHHKKSWLQNLEYILLKARYPIQALKRIIDDIIKNTSLVSEEENCDMVCVRQKDEIRFLENEVDIVSSIMNTVKEMFSLGLFNSSPRQFSMEILKIIEHYSAKSGIRTQIKDAIESSLLVRGSNLGIGQLISRFQFMQELSAKFPMLIDPVIQRRVLANVVFCLPKQNPDNGLYFLPRLDKSTHALLPPDLLKRYQEFFSRKGLNILARPPIALLEEERTHLLPKKYLLLAAAIGSLLIIAAAVAANIAASPAGVSIGAIIIFSLAIIKLYQTYFSTHHDDRSSLIPDIGIFNPAKQ